MVAVAYKCKTILCTTVMRIDIYIDRHDNKLSVLSINKESTKYLDHELSLHCHDFGIQFFFESGETS